MRRWRSGLVTGGTVLVLGALLQLAGPLGLGRLPVVAALVAPRSAVTASLAAIGLVGVGLGVAHHRLRTLLLPTGIALLIAAAIGLPVVLDRGLHREDPAAPGPGTIRILSWNINGDLVAPAVVARLAANEHADLVVLPEVAPAEDGTAYAPAFAAAGLPVRAVPALGSSSVQSVVLVTARLGRWRSAGALPEAPASSALVRPDDGRLPVVLALHAAQPALRGNATWRKELEQAAAACRDPRVVVVGDLNGTLDDLGGQGLGGCRDAAALRSAASLGTWPTAVPPVLAMPIDHVLVAARWSVRSFSVLTSEDASGARHRPILAVLAPR